MSPQSDPNAGGSAPSPASANAGSVDADRTHILPFDLQGTGYCVETSGVSGALGVSVDDSIAGAADPWYAGEVALEGERIRVVDLARIFGSPTPPVDRGENPRLLLFDRTDEEDRHVGWLVDDIGVSATVSRDRLSPSRTPMRFVEGQLEHEGDRLVWVDEEAING